MILTKTKLTSRVKEEYPLKQGLKTPIFIYDILIHVLVKEEYPLKQG